jgi:hypothetical protein
MADALDLGFETRLFSHFHLETFKFTDSRLFFGMGQSEGAKCLLRFFTISTTMLAL